MSRLLEAPLSIRSVVPSPSGDAVDLNCARRDDLVYWRDTSCYRVQFDAVAALAEHIRREEARLAKPIAQNQAEGGEASPDNAGDQNTVKSKRLHLPPGATVGAVSPDGPAY